MTENEKTEEEVTTAPETAETEDTDTEDEEESPSVEDEFRNLFGEAGAEARRLKNLAMKAEQAGDQSAAAVLREVAGGVVQLMQELIATCGGAFQEVESLVNDSNDGSHLDEEDAEKLHGLLTACRKLSTELLTAANDENRPGLQALLALLDDQLDFVLEVSDYQPPDNSAAN